MGYLSAFCNYLDDAPKIVITYGTILKYKRCISSITDVQASEYVIMNGLKDFIRYLDVQNHLDTKGSLIEDAMKMTNVNSKPFFETYSEDEMATIIMALSQEFNEESDEKTKYYYQLICIFVLYILNTAIRAEDLFDLRKDMLFQNPGGTYYYVVHSKTKEEERYEITAEVKKLHDEILSNTAAIRNYSPESNYLFIYKRLRGSTTQRLTPPVVTKAVNQVCRENGIKELGISGIRNRFMRNVSAIILKRGGDPAALIAGVSKHSASVHYRNYFSNDIIQLCRDLYGVTIGDTDLKAIVVHTNPDASISNTVLGGRGHCSVATCDDKTKLDCLMCKHCIVTPQSIPFFQVEIEMLDDRIKNAVMPEEKEFCIAMKTLNVQYLVKCFEVLERGENDDVNSFN